MADVFQTVIDELNGNRGSVIDEPLTATVDDVVAMLRQLQTGASTPSLLRTPQMIVVPGGGTFNYIPPPGLLAVLVKFWGCGGGGGGCLTTPGNCTLSQSGGSGSYVEGFFTAAQIGAARLFTMGIPGAGGDLTGSNGANGTVSKWDTLIPTVQGGPGGIGDPVGGLTPAIIGGTTPSGIPVGGFLNLRGAASSASFRLSGTVGLSGNPGWGAGLIGTRGLSNSASGQNGSIGCGAAAGFSNGTPAARNGGAGGDAMAIVYEYGN